MVTKKRVWITGRDIELFRWLINNKCATARQIARKLGVKKTAVYTRMKKLREAGFLKYERILAEYPGIYLVTRKGVELTGSELGPASVPLSKLMHDLAMVDLGLAIERSGGEYIPERIVRRDLEQDSFQKVKKHKPHIPDGILLWNGKKIAIEVELTEKARRRIENILRQYGKRVEYDEVCYFIRGKRLLEKFREIVTEKKVGYVKIHNFDEVAGC